MPDSQLAYDGLSQHAKETAMLASVESLLGWDERTYLPPGAGAYRAEQMTLLSGMVHRRRTDPRIGDWLMELADSALAADSHSVTGTTIRQLRREYDKQVKLPQSLVEELTRTSVLGQQAWGEARAADKFSLFEPLLEKTFALKRQQAEALGYADHPYDALLDEYEPGERTANLTVVLGGLRDQLVPLVQGIAGSSRRPNLTILERSFPVEAQEAFGKQVAAQLGFDFDRGRLDVTSHPFCSGMGPSDCRITTRYDERFFSSAFFGILHEAGHGIYEQGLPSEDFGLPAGEAVSLGIHESQSRLWENQVGRSQPFWRHFYEPLQRMFPQALADVSFDAFYFAINDVRPSLIRVEADEATYNLHILIRFELEQALLSDDLRVADLPTAWSDKYEQYLGLRPPSDADGVLQDIHWSAGLVGYFPTYSLGNLYSAQLFEAADRSLGGLHAQFEQGQFQPLRSWLREHVHRWGQRYSAAELARRATGEALSDAPLMRHLQGKLDPLYDL